MSAENSRRPQSGRPREGNRDEQAGTKGPARPPTEAELGAVDRALAGLAPIEPSARAVARTQAALVMARANHRRRVVLGRVFVAFAAVLASVGVAVLGRTGADPSEAGDNSLAKSAERLHATNSVTQVDPGAARQAGRFAEDRQAVGDKGNREQTLVDLPPVTLMQGGEAGEVDGKRTGGPVIVFEAPAVANVATQEGLDEGELANGKTGKLVAKVVKVEGNRDGDGEIEGQAGTLPVGKLELAENERARFATTIPPVASATTTTTEDREKDGTKLAGSDGHRSTPRSTIEGYWADDSLNDKSVDKGVDATWGTKAPEVVALGKDDPRGHGADVGGLYDYRTKNTGDAGATDGWGTGEGKSEKGKGENGEQGKKEEAKETASKAKPKSPGKDLAERDLRWHGDVSRDALAHGDVTGALRVVPTADAPEAGARDTDADGLVDQVDACPTTGRGPGGEASNGCPAGYDGGPRVADPTGPTGREPPELTGDRFGQSSALYATMRIRAGTPAIAAEEVAPTFIPAIGYFANTYVPGDPQVAFLRQAVGNGFVDGGRRVALDALAKPVAQPFDAPRDQAIAVHLSADRTAVSGETRMVLQVGLSGAAQAPSRRAPLAVAMVVDLGSIAGGSAKGNDTDRRTLWGIAEAFVGERKEGDRMSLVVPVPGGVEVLGGAALTTTDVAGFLASALERARGSSGALGLAAALDRGYGEVHQGMSADAAMGANVVVLATANAAALPHELAARAHDEALGNVQLAVITTAHGADAGDDGSAALAAAGQGRRWLVARPEDASRVVTQELGAAGRAVARAVRLRIRLAPGVKLVAVLGSHPLAIPETTRVREAERAIDRKVAATTGIREDRGADEDGIQIVIPAFMADDDHAILLDVVVPGPGPVLDVRARFKDLVRMQNGETQASLALDSGASQPTRLTLNVVENRAAYLVATALRDAAAALTNGQPDAAATRLEAAQHALARVGAAAPLGHFVGAQNLLSACRNLVAVPPEVWQQNPTRNANVAQSMLLAAAIQAGAR